MRPPCRRVSRLTFVPFVRPVVVWLTRRGRRRDGDGGSRTHSVLVASEVLGRQSFIPGSWSYRQRVVLTGRRGQRLQPVAGGGVIFNGLKPATQREMRTDGVEPSQPEAPRLQRGELTGCSASA